MISVVPAELRLGAESAQAPQAIPAPRLRPALPQAALRRAVAVRHLPACGAGNARRVCDTAAALDAPVPTPAAEAAPVAASRTDGSRGRTGGAEVPAAEGGLTWSTCGAAVEPGEAFCRTAVLRWPSFPLPPEAVEELITAEAPVAVEEPPVRAEARPPPRRSARPGCRGAGGARGGACRAGGACTRSPARSAHAGAA